MKWIAPHGAATSTERYRNAEPTIAGSNPDAAFFNTVLDELLAVIVAADMTPTDENLHQIADAIEYLTERAATSGVTKGSYWFGKTTANFTVPNPTLPEQNYIDFTTLNTYSAKSDLSGWNQTGTFVPPSGIDFTILITSKFWDIPEQTDQQGGWAQYNHTDDEWSWWPKIINLDNAANLSLSNLNTDGKNIANWSSNVTNCLTEIPQDIKLELGMAPAKVILKSGSKVYVPNGVGVFDEVIIQSDVSGVRNAADCLVFYDNTNDIVRVRAKSEICVGTSDSLSGTAGHCWYDTTNNLIKYYSDGTTLTGYLSLPVGEAHGGSATSSYVDTIDQVFNGFGYIGSTVFVLPGVKGLIPDGRNADGSLKSIEFTVSSVLTTTDLSSATGGLEYYLSGNGIFRQNIGTYEYKPDINYVWDNSANVSRGVMLLDPSAYRDSGKVSSFVLKQVFHAVDYSEADFVVAFQRPTAENNYTWYRKYKSGWVEQGGIQTGVGSYGKIAITLPVKMADNNYQVFANMRDLGNSWYTNNSNFTSLAGATDIAGTASNVSATGFEIQKFSTHTWYVCGMAA